METETDPCTVCGCTEVNLVDGFYYCTECGTRDLNTQETVVEHTFAHDKTVTVARSWKIKTVLKDALQMSGEWLKWHGFNFIVHGLVEELMSLGASKGFREWVLLIWTRYMNEFMNKDKMGAIMEASETDNKGLNKSIFDVEDQEDKKEIGSQQRNYKDEEDSSDDDLATLRSKTSFITRLTLLSILYLGLLYDKSSIQLSHLVKFMHEKKLSLKSCEKFLPKEIETSCIPDWVHFRCDINSWLYTPDVRIRKKAWALITILGLEMPEFPDSRQMVENFVTELCLPNDFKNLVFGLMLKYPIKKLNLTNNPRKVRHYEAIIMAYVVVALKICFGLDSDYEIKISDAVDKINNEENRLKYYKFGPHLESTNRLFSFREWCNFLKYRKMMLCKHYLPYADQYNLDIDIQVFLKHMGDRPKIKTKLEDEIAMDILNKVPSTINGQVIPKSKFTPSLTPITSHTEVLTNFIHDPEIKLLLSEDFTQYSLKYACQHFRLDVNGVNLVKGIFEENKETRKLLIDVFYNDDVDIDHSMVYIRNCENENWLKTNPPSEEHITYTGTGDNGNEGDNKGSDSDHGYDSNVESKVAASDIKPSADEKATQLEDIEEEKEKISIFDDPFDFEVKEEPENNIDENDDVSFWRQISEINHAPQNSDINDEVSMTQAVFDPETFNRAQIIKELVLHACKKYKIVIPKNFKPPPLHTTDSGKRPRTETNPGQIAKKRKLNTWTRIESTAFMEKILTAYEARIEKDFLDKVSHHVSSVVNTFRQENEITDVCVDNSDMILNQDETMNENNNEGTDSILIDRSVEEIGNEDILPIRNENFDEKTHDIKQLYIKCRDRLQFEDILDFDDPEIEEVLGKKILESKNNDPISNDKVLSKKNLMSSNKEDTKKEKDFPKLIDNPKSVKKLKLWCRHYGQRLLGYHDCSDVFNTELKEKMPKSFMFVITECASIISCTPYNIYKYVNKLEKLF